MGARPRHPCRGRSRWGLTRLALQACASPVGKRKKAEAAAPLRPFAFLLSPTPRTKPLWLRLRYAEAQPISIRSVMARSGLVWSGPVHFASRPTRLSPAHQPTVEGLGWVRLRGPPPHGCGGGAYKGESALLARHCLACARTHSRQRLGRAAERDLQRARGLTHPSPPPAGRSMGFGCGCGCGPGSGLGSGFEKKSPPQAHTPSMR